MDKQQYNRDHHLHLAPVPSLIAVHGVVSTDNRGNLSKADLLGLSEKLLKVTSTALGVSVSAITEEVDEHLGHSDLLGKLKESVEVSLLGVNTAVADQALSCNICQFSSHESRQWQ
jgi:nitrogen fixation/metabolism regulation signal transduction histidine kinase